MKLHVAIIKQVLFVLLCQTALSSANAAEELKIWLGASVQQGILKDQVKPFEEKTKIKLVTPGDAAKNNANLMLKDVIEGNAEAAATAAPYADWSAAAKQDLGIKDEKLRELTYRVIGRDNLAILAHKDVGVSTLTLEQLEGVLTGKVRKWNQVGGKDLPVVLLLAKKPATNDFVKRQVLKGAEFGAAATNITEYDEYFDKMAATPGSVGLAPAAATTSKLQVIKTPVIGRPITLVTRGKPSPKVQAFIDYVQKLGQ